MLFRSIVRGLLAAWRATQNAAYLTGAKKVGLSMGHDFWSAKGELHPILALPSKEPFPYEKRWSREPGCLQLKSALAWAQLAKHFPGEAFEDWWERALRYSLDTHLTFLPGVDDELKVMDRLHAYSYFLEALLAATEHEEVRTALRWGIDRTGTLLREIGPVFERSDVNAQLLRVRLMAHHMGVVQLDEIGRAHV